MAYSVIQMTAFWIVLASFILPAAFAWGNPLGKELLLWASRIVDVCLDCLPSGSNIAPEVTSR